jgi:predicted N-acetyltransferase YhbS
LNGATQLKKPLACTDQELEEFARLVRQGFDGSDAELPARIRRASRLAFHFGSGHALAAIAALKVPGDQHIRELFLLAGLSVDPSNYNMELGWVFVVPESRGCRIADGLCRELLAQAPSSHVFATTRVGNARMRRTLHRLGFEPAGRPYPRRDQRLEVFLPSSAQLKERETWLSDG